VVKFEGREKVVPPRNRSIHVAFTTARDPPLAKVPLPEGKALEETYDMKLAGILTVSFLLLSSSIVTVRAAELCFQLNNFIDIFSLEFTGVGVNSLVLGKTSRSDRELKATLFH
jgi:hypothetical protein